MIVVGLNHRTVPLEVLERMTVDDSRLPKALHDLRSRDDIVDAIIVSTCNRTEIYVVANRYHAAVGDVRDFLRQLGNTPVEDFADHIYELHDDTAIRHLFRVAAGLDSAIVGEFEVLGQVREAWERARDEDAAGPVLSALFRHAVEVGRRVRAETGIARGTTSVSQAAVQMATNRLGSLEGRTILVLGAGDMGEGMAVALAGSAKAGEVLVVNRTWSKAVALANRVAGRAVQLGGLAAALEGADVLLTSTGSPSVLLEAADLEPVMAERPDRPLLIVDVAVPRDVDQAVGDLEGVTLLDMDDLRAFADAGLEGRRKEMAKVEDIVTEEVERHLATATARRAAPLVVELRERAEAIRQAELERYRSRLAHLDDADLDAVDALTRGLLAKLLHEPTVRVKEESGSPKGDVLAEALRTLFDL